MGKSCCATGCTNRFNKKSELSFYRLPKNKERRSKWIAAIGRSNWNPGSETWICGFHFASGKKSDDPLHPDYVPSIFSFTSPTNQTRPVNNLKKYQGSQEVSGKRFANTSREQTAAGGLNLHQNPASDVEVQAVKVQGTGVQTEETHSDITSLHEQIKSLNSECQSLRDIVYKLENEIKCCTLDTSEFDDSKIHFFTGLPNLQTFMLLFSNVSSVLPAPAKQSLKPTQELLLTLMKLRFSLSEGFLGHLFGIHQSTVSRIFRRWMHVTTSKLQQLKVETDLK
uniref:THAP-type domain-containing protein n=1 Tax=Paramormyrops kingsleyae TaxID=1676925 RepID=A0A3B3QLV8_9TELE